jgi:hypothetical protein
MKNSSLKWLWIPVTVIVVVLLACVILWLYFSPAFSTLSPRESALKETRQLLSAIATHPVGPMPNDLSRWFIRLSQKVVSGQRCICFLEKVLINKTVYSGLTQNRLFTFYVSLSVTRSGSG